MDIDYILKCLSEINESNLYLTKHFEIKLRQRKNDLVPDINSIYSKILNEKPVSIAKQNETKFKLLYILNDDYDLAIIISSSTHNPISFNLVTHFIENSDKRKREDNDHKNGCE